MLSAHKASLFLIASLLSTGAWAATTVTVGSASGQAGTTVNVPFTFSPGTATVEGITFNVGVPASLSTGTYTLGAILTAANKGVNASFSNGVWTFVIFGISNTAIAAGTLFTAQMTIAPGTTPSTLNLTISNVNYSDPSGSNPPATGIGGSVSVVPAAPVITSPATSTGTVGVAFSYPITATNSPTLYSATNLPAGLSINTGTGLISGTPTATGTSNVTLSATNAGGTATLALTLTTYSGCDVNRNGGAPDVGDVQAEVNAILTPALCNPAPMDLNQNGRCDVGDVQRIVNVILGGSCVVGP